MNTTEDLLQLQRFRLQDPFSDSSPYRVGVAVSESDILHDSRTRSSMSEGRSEVMGGGGGGGSGDDGRGRGSASNSRRSGSGSVMNVSTPSRLILQDRYRFDSILKCFKENRDLTDLYRAEDKSQITRVSEHKNW